MKAGREALDSEGIVASDLTEDGCGSDGLDLKFGAEGIAASEVGSKGLDLRFGAEIAASGPTDDGCGSNRLELIFKSRVLPKEGVAIGRGGSGGIGGREDRGKGGKAVSNEKEEDEERVSDCTVAIFEFCIPYLQNQLFALNV